MPDLKPTPAPLSTKAEDEVIAQALASRQDLQATDNTLNGTEWDITNARAPYYPRLDLAFYRVALGRYLTSALLNGQDVMPASQIGLVPQVGQQVNYSVNLVLSWDVFDHLLTRNNVVRTRIISDNARIDRDDLRIKIVADVRQARGDYSSAQRRVRSAQEGVLAAQKAFDTIQGRYQVGASSFIDLLAAQAALVQAEANQAQAVIQLKLQEKTLLYVTGADLL